MTYAEWRQENEKKYAELVDGGALHEFPAFNPETHTAELCDGVDKIVDELIDDDLITPMHFACVFAEYLFEKYHLDPADCEFMGLYFTKGMLAYMNNASAETINRIMSGEIFRNTENIGEVKTEDEGNG